MKEHDKRRSLCDVLMEVGTTADGRKKKGIRHHLGVILILLTMGYMMGSYEYKSTYYLFNPVAVFSGDGKKPDKKRKKAARESMTEDEVRFWSSDIVKSRKDAKKLADTIYGQLRKLGIPLRGIPHYSTMSRALAAADAVDIVIALYELFVQMIPEDSGKRHLAIDGKALRAALNRAVEGRSLYILNCYDVAARLFITTFKVGEKKNEASTLINEIENLLLGNPSIVTMDAAGTNQELIRIMVNLGSDYVLPVKGNQKKLEDLINRFFLGQVSNRTETIESAVDIGGHSEQDAPCKVIKPKVFRVVKEANRKAGAYAPDNSQPKEEPAPGPGSGPEREKGQDPKDDQVSASTEDSSGDKQSEDLKGDALKNPEEKPETEKQDIPAVTDDGKDSQQEDEEIVTFEWPETFPLFRDQFCYLDEAPALDESNKDLIAVQCGETYVTLARNGERFERVEYLVIQTPQILEDSLFKTRFESVRTVILVNRYRLYQKYDSKIGKHWELALNTVPYISNKLLTAQDAQQLINGQWAIETSHRTLDVVMREDACTARSSDAPWILSALRKSALNIINYVGGKWATIEDKAITCTQGAYEVRVLLNNNLEMAVKYMGMELKKAVNIF